ncbi:hypothetical protein [Hymenobacter rubidus]|uniref:hypothetical protein n=1 Tax=Hymenobacter rubidus TaxID=1441626 RepID=UPI00191CFE22|nr:hypothetical protein [Hymenobacter rubidus]
MTTTVFFGLGQLYQRLVLGLGLLLVVHGTIQAQCGLGVSISPAGTVSLPASGSLTLTAAANTPGFNVGGQGCGTGTIRSIVPLPDCKAFVLGAFLRYNNDPATPLGMIRINADGLRDVSFNAGGTGFSGGLSGSGTVHAVVVQPDGKILVGGEFTTYNGLPVSRGLVRLNPNGSLDPSFNAGGTGFGGTNTSTVYSLAVLPNGSILAGSTATSYNGDTDAPDLLVRLFPDGSLDPSFNVGGDGFYPAYGVISNLLVLPSGKILAGGEFSAYNLTSYSPRFLQRLRLMRLEADGSPDATFMPQPPGQVSGFNVNVRGLTLLADGSITVCSSSTTLSGSAIPFGLVKLTPNGVLDPTFNTAGANFDSFASQVIEQPGGKLLVGGNMTTYQGVPVSRYLLRLNPNGTVDTSFNSGGTGFDQYVGAIAVQADGRIIVGGNLGSYNGVQVPPTLFRLNADASPNATSQPVPGATYRWNTGATTPNLTVATPGTYSVAVTAGGNTVQSSNVTVPAAVMATRQNSLLPTATTLFPNPASHATTLLLPAGPGAPRIEIALYNALGQCLRTYAPRPLPATGLKTDLDISNLASGLYSLRLTVEGCSIHRPLLVD